MKFYTEESRENAAKKMANWMNGAQWDKLNEDQKNVWRNRIKLLEAE